MGRKILGVLFALVMIAVGIRSIVRGVRQMRSLDDDGLSERVLPVPTTVRPWEVCPPDEVAYAASRPAWTPLANVDFAAPWTSPERIRAATAILPIALATSGTAPRDCSAASSAAFRRLATADDFLALAGDESASTTARAAALSELIQSQQPVLLLYCGEAGIDDYQWECARAHGANLRIAAAMLALTTRVAVEDPSVLERSHWVSGEARMRSGIATMAGDILRLLELPAGVRPSVRALFAHTLAEDHPPARAYVTDAALLAPLRARLAALAARETQPEVRDALALALARWP